MPGAMTRSLLAQLLLVNCVFAITQNCVFKTGVAEGYVACDPNASQGTCCVNGETCLESGLCYGGLGLVYRRACLNAWSSSGCVTYCDDKSVNWANLYPCTDGSGSSTPSYWWCGNDTDVTCSKTSGTVLDITPGLAISASSSSSTTSTTSSPTPSTTTTQSSQQTTSCASSTQSCDKSDWKVTAVGAGVGASLGALSLAMLVLFLNERRRRKKVERAATVERVMGAVDHYATERKPEPQELGIDERLNELGPRY